MKFFPDMVDKNGKPLPRSVQITMKVLVSILVLFTLTMIIAMIWLITNTFKVEDDYLIKRSNDIPPKVEITTEYKMFDRVQYVPKKAHTKLGLEYFCTIEMTDSTFLVDYTTYYLGRFEYEGLRFFAWNLIETTSDTTFSPISDININEISTNGDTIFYKGLKIYDVEPYSLDKYIQKDSENLLYNK